MDIIREDPVLVVKLDRGEEVMTSLARLVTDQSLSGASFSGIGAVSHANIGFYRIAGKRYEVVDFEENLEVISLLGSLAHGPEGPVVHAHVSLGRADYSVIGGHLFAATVSVTMELFVTLTASRLERQIDPRFDLNLLKLG